MLPVPEEIAGAGYKESDGVGDELLGCPPVLNLNLNPFAGLREIKITSKSKKGLMPREPDHLLPYF